MRHHFRQLHRPRSFSPSTILCDRYDVFYGSHANRWDARKLGERLRRIGFFTGSPKDVLIARPESRYEVSFFLVEDAWNEEDGLEYFSRVGDTLATYCFGYPMVIRLLGQEGKLKKVLKVE